jgi:hypothetical protein
MKKCYECGKKLQFWEGYHHPILGKRELVCKECFDILEESILKYSDFIIKEIKQGKEIKIDNNFIMKFKNIISLK